MPLNISLPSAVFSLMESKRWYGPTGQSLKDVQTLIQFTSIYVDVSDYVRSIDIEGSVENLSGRPGANRASVEFGNNDKRFSDLYTAGPYYGALLPGRPVRIQMSIGASVVTIFQGRVSQAGFSESRDGLEGSASIEVVDEADAMQRRKFKTDFYYTDKKLVDESDAGNSLLHILLQNHFSILSADIVTNGDVAYTVPYTLFKEGGSIWGQVQEVARASLAQYCGFRYDGKFVMESRLVAGWSVPSAEYTLVASQMDATISKSLEPLLANRVKVRGPIMDVNYDCVVWELRQVKPVGTNAVYPGWCWENVAPGAWYLCDYSVSPYEEYWAQYEVSKGEIVHVQSLAMSQKIWNGASFELHTDNSAWSAVTDLAAEPRRGRLVLMNSAANTVQVMNLQIKGTAVVKRTISRKFEEDAALEDILHAQGLSDDDFDWGRVLAISNASSIAAYGQTDMVIDSDFFCSDDQMNRVADWFLKQGKDPTHRFGHEGLPFLAFMQPGATVSFAMAELGYSALVQVESFGHRITAQGAETSLQLMEVPGSWSMGSAIGVPTIVAAPTGGTGQGEIGAAAMNQNVVVTIGASDSSTPCDFRCLGGVSEDSTLQAIIEWGHSIGANVFQFGKGTFHIDDHLSSYAGMTFYGQGDETVIELSSAAYGAFWFHGTSAATMVDCAVRDMKITGEYNNQILIQPIHVDGLAVRNVTFEGGWLGVDMKYCNGVEVSNCWIDGMVDAITGVVLTNSKFVNNHIRNCNFGIDLYGDATWATGYSTWVGLVCYNILIDGNSFDGPDDPDPTLSAALCFTTAWWGAGGGAKPAVLLEGIKNATITNNGVGRWPGGGVVLYALEGFWGETITTEGCVVSGNVISESGRGRWACGMPAIHVEGDRCLIDGNVIEDFEGQWPAIQVYTIADSTIVSGNSARRNRNLMGNVSVFAVERGAFNDGWPLGVSGMSSIGMVWEGRYYNDNAATIVQKKVSSAISARWYMVPSLATSLHSLIAGLQYEWQVWLRVPTAGGVSTASAVGAFVEWYSSAAWTVTTKLMTAKDLWEGLFFNFTLPSTAVDFHLGLMMSTGASISTFVAIAEWYHSFRLRGNRNFHDSQFVDLGTNTKA
jgi:hypothetical protein